MSDFMANAKSNQGSSSKSSNLPTNNQRVPVPRCTSFFQKIHGTRDVAAEHLESSSKTSSEAARTASSTKGSIPQSPNARGSYQPYENQTCGCFPGSGGGFSPHQCEDFPPAKIPPNFGGKMKQKVPPFLRGFWNGDC